MPADGTLDALREATPAAEVLQLLRKGAKAAEAIEATPKVDPRILVIGATGYPADRCEPWDALTLNAADFDAVIVVTPSQAETYSQAGAQGLRDQLVTLLESGGDLFVVATEEVSWKEPVTRGGYHSMSNFSWAPITFGFSDEVGETRRDVDDAWRWYFDRITRWTRTVSHPESDKGLIAAHRKPNMIMYQVRPLAANRYGRALGTEVALVELRPTVASEGYRIAIRPEDIRWERTGVPFGRVYVLPVAEPWHWESVLAEVLAHRFGRIGRSAAPEWAVRFGFPPTNEEDAEIEMTGTQISALLARRSGALERREVRRAALGLLYESGTALERLVESALVEMGVAILPAHAQEEFTATWNGSSVVIEIKGNSKSASQDDHRALMDYLVQHEMSGTGVSRGTLVVNAWRLLEPSTRPAWFPDNVVRSSRLQGKASLLRTEDLYQALLAWRSGDFLKVEAFLGRVFTESGEIRWG
jgi:hypothetical protein